MSYLSYIGCNFELPISDCDSGDFIKIGCGCSEEKERIIVKNQHFSTPYVYDLDVDSAILLTKEWGQETWERSKDNLIELCKVMDAYLQKGDYFELYTCNLGEEDSEQESQLTLQLRNFDINQIIITDRTFVRFEKI